MKSMRGIKMEEHSPNLGQDHGCLLKRLNRGSIQRTQTISGIEIDDTDLIEAFYDAYKEAELSPDPNTQVGAVILDWDGEINMHRPRGYGYNKFPDRVKDKDRWTTTDKNIFVSHAEHNAIVDYTNIECKHPKGKIMVATWAACHECAKDIIDFGIAAVISDYRCHEFNAKVRGSTGGWAKSVHYAMDMFEEAGVEFYTLDPTTSNLFNYDKDLKKIKIARQWFQP